MNRPSPISRDESGAMLALLPLDAGKSYLLPPGKLGHLAYPVTICLRSERYTRRSWILFPHYWRPVP